MLLRITRSIRLLGIWSITNGRAWSPVTTRRETDVRDWRWRRVGLALSLFKQRNADDAAKRSRANCDNAEHNPYYQADQHRITLHHRDYLIHHLATGSIWKILRPLFHLCHKTLPLEQSKRNANH